MTVFKCENVNLIHPALSNVLPTSCKLRAEAGPSPGAGARRSS
jgi:hypothetical protein